MNRAAEYRKLAEECRSLAQRAQTQDEREQILEMVYIWENLAERREAAAENSN